MKVALLYPGRRPTDALWVWMQALARHCREHEVTPAHDPTDCEGADVALLLTASETYPRGLIDSDRAALRDAGPPFGVVHNEHSPPVPSPGDYPSFCWTRRAHADLASRGYVPTLLRMPLFPRLPGEGPPPGAPPFAATFGSVEPKKNTWGLYDWCRRAGVKFWAFCPEPLLGDHPGYVAGLRADGCEVRAHPWAETPEALAPLFRGVTHFLFDVRGTKGGTGGCPTSPRYAGFFGRPAVVVDDETIYAEDGCTVVSDTHHSPAPPLRGGSLQYGWSPDAYVGALAEAVLAFGGRA